MLDDAVEAGSCNLLSAFLCMDPEVQALAGGNRLFRISPPNP